MTNSIPAAAKAKLDQIRARIAGQTETVNPSEPDADPAPIRSIGPETELAIKQAGLIANEIASIAVLIDEIFFFLPPDCGDGVCRADTDCAAVRWLTAVSGLMADMAASKLGESTIKGANPEAWLMPPVYPQSVGGL